MNILLAIIITTIIIGYIAYRIGWNEAVKFCFKTMRIEIDAMMIKMGYGPVDWTKIKGIDK